MGILDDAIRQHLELKRRQGAGEDELARLEDEAFGPPSRPGEPDFPERNGDADAERMPDADGDAPPLEATAATAAPAEGILQRESLEEQPEAETAFYDHRGDEAGIRELEPELDPELEPIEDAGAIEVVEPEPGSDAGESPAEAEPGPPEDRPPIEALDTVEHPIEEAEVVEDEPPAGSPGIDEADGEGSEGAGEDVLEETPEFLRDQPEDDELWFEQGEPKDFDF